MQDLIQQLASELDKDPRHVENVVRLLDEGNTIPFIARYRKELHGAMDDTALRTLEERLQYLRGLEERREAVKRSIDEQGKHIRRNIGGALNEPACVVGTLILPHAISSCTPSLSTMNLSLGERPVYFPVRTHRAPVLLS